MEIIVEQELFQEHYLDTNVSEDVPAMPDVPPKTLPLATAKEAPIQPRFLYNGIVVISNQAYSQLHQKVFLLSCYHENKIRIHRSSP